MRKLVMSLAMVLGMTSTASADYTFVVPQKPGGGTTVWTEIVAKELEPFLGEKIIIKTIPGARDIPGFNEFHNKLQKTIKL
jgi:tripartite-type tricarboxylate transporter receptor subunit TctC